MINREQVKHIAKLARISLSSGEEQQFEKDLSGILDFIAEINQIDLGDIEPLLGGSLAENVMRSDVAGDGGMPSGQQLLDQSPHVRAGYIEVKAVFDRSV